MSKHILFKLASRERPGQMIAAIENIIQFVDDNENFSILVSVDEDDPKIYKQFPSMQSLVDFKAKYNNKVFLQFGVSKNKIDAINRDIKNHNVNWHILVNFSDDMEWIVQGFDNVIREAFEKHGYNNFLHIRDQNNYHNVAEPIASMSIMDRDYYEKFGYVYNPAYYSFFCDNEAVDVAMMMNEYIDYRKEQILFIHKHYAHDTKFSKDELYKKNNVHYAHDKEVYYLRKANNFKN